MLFLNGIIGSLAIADWDPGDGHKMHFPQLPDEVGWDVHDSDPMMLADDWQCSHTGLVDDIHFWGSWRDLNGDQIGDVGNITEFVIRIFTDIPAEQNPLGYSTPGALLREWHFPFTDIQVRHIDPPLYLEGWYDPTLLPPGNVVYNDHGDYWQYNIVNISQLVPEPLVQVDSTIYWLSVSAVVMPSDPQQEWGWKTSIDHFNDDAVRWDPVDSRWIDLFEPPRMNYFDVTLDPNGIFVSGTGTNYYDGGNSENGWYFYENEDWWNIWFYDNPFSDERQKIAHINFMVRRQVPIPFVNGMLTLAINYSTPLTPPGQPPLPPLTPEDEELFIGRTILVNMPVTSDYGQPVMVDAVIPDYNPEWVSIDVRGFNFVIFDGQITHECVDQQTGESQSLDLAFVITGPAEEIGACCHGDPFNPTCTNTTQADCEVNLQGTWYAGSDCNDPTFQCPSLAACCFPDGSCADMTQQDCQNAGGQWNPTTSCMGDNNGNYVDDACEGLYPMGACCLTDNSCIVTYQSVCQNIAGAQYMGDGTDCSDNNGNQIADICEGPPSGACCFPDGSCADMVQLDCQNAGGQWNPTTACQGDNNSNFVDDACEGIYPMGACCLSDNSCIVTYQAACQNIAGAQYMGDGTDCSDNNGNQIADICEEEPIDTCSYYKAPFPDYAPAGVPDFDQKQDFTGDGITELTWCGPTALADCFWWFDSKFETNTNPPPAVIDNYPLVTAYGQWDDHDPNNVIPFIDSLARYCNTDGLGPGTFVYDLAAGASGWLAAAGLSEAYTVNLIPVDDFDFIRQEVLRSQNVILLLGFWQESGPGYCERIGGHYVTVAGTCPDEMALCISDPFFDYNEGDPPGPPHLSNIHNDAQFVSGPHGTMHHDKYYVGPTPCMPHPGYPPFAWEFVNYPVNPAYAGYFFGQNTFDPAIVPTDPTGAPLHTILEFALIICPVEEQHGACCFPDGTCASMLEADCLSAGGTWSGAGTTCMGDGDGNLIDDACESLYPMGACCFADQSCVVTYEAACDLVTGAEYKGDGTDCTDSDANQIADICEAEPQGACCFPDGTCGVMIEADCDNAGGSWAGPFTSCMGDGDGNLIDDACEGLYPSGACCFADQSCVVTYEDACDLVSGAEYKGDGTDCADADANSIADICELPAGFDYMLGDVNMYNGTWPPSVIGSDVTYLVNYFRGMSTNPACLLHNPLATVAPTYFFAAADINGDCNVIGSDVTRLVNYFRGTVSISNCLDYPPNWPPVPPSAPAGWPGCQTPPLLDKIVIPSESGE